MKKILSIILCVVMLAGAVIPLSSCEKSGDNTETTPADTGIEEETSVSETTADETTADETSAEETTEEETTAEEDHAVELIPDLKFEKGISLISQKDHSNHDKFVTLGSHSFYQGKEAKDPVWRLAQWDSGPCLVENMIDAGVSSITDGKWRNFSYDPVENVMTFKLDTSLYYQGKPAKQGDYWPHLLIEQSDFGYGSMSEEMKSYYNCASEKLIFSMDIRLDEYELTKIQGDWVDAAQFLIYFYVKGIETNDFCWFGVQLFDNRVKFNTNYIGYDGGKPDASGAMIYSVGSKDIYDKNSTFWGKRGPEASDKWLHIEIDLKPYLEDMLKVGKRDGYFKADSLGELCINGMNLGWETIGTFNNSISVRNLSLKSYPPIFVPAE